MSPRFIQTPVSGRDRRHHFRELERVRRLQADLVRQTDEAFARAYLLACEEWNARQFIGGPADPSPFIYEALLAGCNMLDVRCARCGRARTIQLNQLIWPRDKPIHTIANILYCHDCAGDRGRRVRPNIEKVRTREPIDDLLDGTR